MSAATPRVNNLGQFYTNLGQTANKHFNSISNFIKENTPTNLNSLLPLGNNTKTPNVKINTNGKPFNEWFYPLIIFIVVTLITVAIIIKFQDKISAGFNNIGQKIRAYFEAPSSPLVDASKPKDFDVTDKPVPPQDENATQIAVQKTAPDILNTIVPLANPEVFNVSKNEFTYYDAEPLCRALGAELATYDQVKEAWSKGADWCNYGWVKGQAAVYPTQEETWKKIQAGPEEDRNSCGVVGLNGGYFENPEMKFGVNCYGAKPAQSEHDEEVLMKQGQLPRSVPGLVVDQKVQQFKEHATEYGILPFNTKKWQD
jgi:hypothetical protein